MTHERNDSSEQDKERLISLAEVSEIYGFDQRYLAKLAKRGRLQAEKIGNIWVTTQADVDEYIRSREKRGAYRDDIEPCDD